MAKSLLLASFVKKEELYDAVNRISEVLKIKNTSIFVFLEEDDDKNYIITYNLDAENANIEFSCIWKDTINVHRKKQTRTIYSLNAMNELIKQKNNGHLDKGYAINWENYKDCALIIKNKKLRVIPIRMIKINQ